MHTHSFTAGLSAFEQANCEDCYAPCRLHTAACQSGVSAPELRTIQAGICPYHQNGTVLAWARHANDLTDYHDPCVQAGITLAQRIMNDANT